MLCSTVQSSCIWTFLKPHYKYRKSGEGGLIKRNKNRGLSDQSSTCQNPNKFGKSHTVFRESRQEAREEAKSPARVPGPFKRTVDILESTEGKCP